MRTGWTDDGACAPASARRAAAALLAAAGLMLAAPAQAADEAPPAARLPRHIRYGFTLQNTRGSLLEKAELWTYAPVRKTATQECVGIKASRGHEMAEDELGNQVMHFSFTNLAPFGSAIVAIDADLLVADQPEPSAIDAARHLRPERHVEWDDPEFARLAPTFSETDKGRLAEAIFEWTSRSLKDTGYLRDPLGALRALKEQRGDCTEFMHLFLALCRRNGIPARGIGGYVLDRNAVLRPAAYHNWAEFHEGGAWRLADPQRKVFRRQASQFIAMQILGETTNAMGAFPRYRCSGEGLKVTMN